MRAGREYCHDMWCTLIGCLSWNAAIHCGLLASLDRVYSDTRHIDRKMERVIAPCGRVHLKLTPVLLTELADIVSVLRLERVCGSDNIWRTIIAFDASVTTWVINYAHTSAL